MIVSGRKGPYLSWLEGQAYILLVDGSNPSGPTKERRLGAAFFRVRAIAYTCRIMDLLQIAIVTVVSAFVGTVAGFGTSTIMIPVLLFFLSPAEAILFGAIVHWFGDLWKIALFPSGFDRQLIVLFGVTGFAASFVGAALSLDVDAQMLSRSLGAFLVVHAVVLLANAEMKLPVGRGTALVGGVLSGFFAGLFGIGGAVRSAFLSLFKLPKATYIATLGAIGLLVDSTRIITYVAGGTRIPERFWWGMPLFVAVSFAGAWVGKSVVGRIPQRVFGNVVAGGLFLLGVRLVLFS